MKSESQPRKGWSQVGFSTGSPQETRLPEGGGSTPSPLCSLAGTSVFRGGSPSLSACPRAQGNTGAGGSAHCCAPGVGSQCGRAEASPEGTAGRAVSDVGVEPEQKFFNPEERLQVEKKMTGAFWEPCIPHYAAKSM